MIRHTQQTGEHMNRRQIIAGFFTAGLAWIVASAIAIRHVERQIMRSASDAVNDGEGHAA